MFDSNASGRKIYVPRNSVNAYKSAAYWSDYADYIFEEAELAPANNEIWYTSSDGSIITPNESNAFGANIVSNTYENGQGVILFDAPVTSIGEGAFQWCDSLTSVTIPDSVTLIGSNAFYECTSLTEVYCKATTPPIGNLYMFPSNASNSKIYVPTSSVNAYKSATNWSEYASDIVGYDFTE